MRKQSKYYKRHCEMNTWTQTALDCYEIGATCCKCYLPVSVKKRCRMRDKIITIVKIYGKPYDRTNNFIGE